MKRHIALIIILILTCGPVLAESPKVGPDAERAAHRAEMTHIKKQMRERESSGQNTPAPKKTAPTFWEKEGERSGLAQTGTGAGQFVRNLNPVPFFKEQQKRYNERKAQKTR